MLVKPVCLHFLTATRVNIGAVNMENLSKCMFFIALTMLILRSCYAETTKFDVVPGGQERTMEKSLGDVTCKFTYACQGGTKEEWDMEISTEDNTQLCRIYRLNSYLYFVNFKVEVEGANVMDAQGYNGDKQIGTDQFLIEDKKVSSTKKFENKLTGIDVQLTQGKEEL